MLERTYLQCAKVFNKNNIYVATDSVEIELLCKKNINFIKTLKNS